MLLAPFAYHISSSMLPLRTVVALIHVLRAVSLTAAIEGSDAGLRTSTVMTSRSPAVVAVAGDTLSCVFAVVSAPPKVCATPGDVDAAVALTGAPIDPRVQTNVSARATPSIPRRSNRREPDPPDIIRPIDFRASPRDRLRHIVVAPDEPPFPADRTNSDWTSRRKGQQSISSPNQGVREPPR